MQVQQQPSKVTQSPKKQLPILQKLSKSQKTYNVEYEIIRELRKQIGKPSECDFELFKNIYNGLSKDIKNTLAYRLLNYQIWNNQNLPVQIREKTQFFAIVSEWIVVFQMKVGDLKNLTKQIQFLNQFFIKETKDIFEKVVLIDQIHEDLVELLGREFWGLEILEPEAQPKISATKEEAVEFLKFLGNLIQYYSMFQSEHPMPVYNCQLYLLRQKSQHYKQFIFRSIEYILSVNSGKKPVQKYLQKHQEMQLTRIALIFLQRPDIEPKKSIGLLQMLMLRTSKVVRYAMVVDYVRLYNYLERSNQYQILQELENMVYFRELIIGHSQIDQAGLISNHLGRPFTIFTITARTKQRILISHEPEFGKFSILQLQFLIEGGDISLAIYNMKNGKQNLHWKQQRTEDRRIDIMLKEEGLYIIQMDNTYSWIKPKKVSFKIEQFCIGCQGL